MTFKRVNSVILTGLLWPVLTSSSWAQTESASSPSSAILVLDASGSMWGEMGETTKIGIARDVIDDMLTTWDKDTPLGLMAYGHRKKGDCTDIELLQAPAKLDSAAFSKKVRALNPTGKTPMVQSVIDAAEALSYEDNKSTVILISDGEETCGLDPCEIGRSLKDKGVDFTAHVIGFGVTFEQSAGLQCLAETTGGRYLPAEDAGELSDAIRIAAEDATTETQDVIGDASVEVIPVEVVAGSDFNVKWDGPQNRLDSLTVLSLDGKTRFDSIYVYDSDTPDTVKLRAPETPGQYRVHYYTRQNKSLAQDDLTVIAAKATVDAPDDPVQGGAEFPVKVTGDLNQGDRLLILNEAGERVGSSNKYVSSTVKDGVGTLRAPETPGTYTVIYRTRGGKTLAQDEFSVTAAEAFIDAPETDIIGGVQFPVKISEANESQDRVLIRDKDGKRVGSTSLYIKNDYKDGFVTARAPEKPGTYTVEYSTREDKVLASDDFTVIAATASVEAPKTDIIGGHEFRVKVSEPNDSQDRIFVRDGDGKRVGSSSLYIKNDYKDGYVVARAPEEPGTYTVEYITRDGNSLASDPITVIAATATLSAPDGNINAQSEITLKVSEPQLKSDKIRFVDKNGKRVGSSNLYVYSLYKNGVVTVTAPEKPGTYGVEYISREKRVLASDMITVVGEK